MCFSIAYAERNRLEKLYGPLHLEPQEVEQGIEPDFERAYFVSAFSLPKIPVVTNQRPENIQLLHWGLIPRWVKDRKKAEQIRLQTLNARAETIFEKPSYRSSARDRRCLILVDGFYEWRDVGGRNYPYFIRMRGEKPFALAGIWEVYKEGTKGAEGQGNVSPTTPGETEREENILRTCSVITTRANPLLAKIHNKKKRMPAILEREDEKRWLSYGEGREDIMGLLEPIDDSLLEAHTVSKLVSMKGANKNVPQAVEPFEYPEIKFEQTRLF